MEEKRRAQIEGIRKEMAEKEAILREEEERKRVVFDSLRRKDELKKVQKLEVYKRRLRAESKRAEQNDKRRKDKLEERNKVLDEWHRQKIDTTKKRSLRKKDLSVGGGRGLDLLPGVSYFDDEFYGDRASLPPFHSTLAAVQALNSRVSREEERD